MISKLKNLILLWSILGIFVGCQQNAGTVKYLKHKTVGESLKNKDIKDGSSPIDSGQAPKEISPDSPKSTVLDVNVSLAQAVLDSIDGTSTPLSPTLSISNIGLGVLLEVLQGADASCNGGTVLSTTVSTSTTATMPAPFLGGAAPVSLRVRSTDAAGNVTCSTTSVAYTNPNAGFYKPDSGQNKLALSQHACSVVNDSLYCWGRNNYSQLGDGTTTTSTTPKPVAGMNGGVSSIAVSEGHTCVVKSGAVYCWGSNSNLQADASWASSQTTPTMYPTLTQNITALSVGGTGTSGFGCAIKSGALICWGNNSNNQVTNNPTNCNTSCTVEASSLNTGVTAVSTGSNFACAIQDAGSTTGSLYCWGGNAAGQLGDNSTTQRAAPTAVAAPSNSWTSISADPSSTSVCGINSGKIYCWGTNTSGQLGLGNTTSVLVPTLVPDTANFLNSGVSAVSVNNQKACAIKDAGLYCWGSNSNGAIYSATTNNLLAPLAVSTFSSGVTSIAVGYSSICAVQNNLTKCWGANTYGELGIGSIGFPSSVLSPSQSVLSGGTISSYVNGTTSSAIQSGALKVWGSNSSGQFGNGGTVGGPMPVVPTGLESGVTYASLSTSGSFGIKDGGLYSWGANNANGFLGNGNTSPQYTPAPLALGNSTSAVTSIVQSTGLNYAYALKGGGLFYWGLNTSGQSGNGTTTSPVTSPFEVFSAGSGVSDVLISSHSGTGTSTTACAIKNGSLWCWGNNAYGQVGDGTVTSPRTSPYEVAVGGSTNNVTAVKSSLSGTSTIFQRASTCALKNGALYCWGDNSNGQLGKGNTAADYTTAISTPISFGGTTTGVTDFNLKNVTNTDTYPGVCALQSGSLWCWGYNVFGLAGDGSVTSPVTSPYKTLDGASGGSVTSFTIGTSSSVSSWAIKGGSLYVWGANSAGQAGKGDLVTPVTTPYLTLDGASGGSVTSFTSGTSTSVPSWAIKGGALYVWGPNTGGQVGNGTTNLITNPVTTPYQTLPATVDGSGNGSVSKVILGVGSAQSSCALKGGGLYCWGPNTSGQLGQNSTTANYTPTLVPGLETGVTDFVGLNGTLFCAIKNGALYCWGANTTGKVGNGTTANVLSPYKVFDAGVTQVSLTSGTCATVFNNIKCWGPGSSGELGVTEFSGLSYPLAKVGNVKPVLSSLNNQNTTVDVALNNIPFTINDNDNSPSALSCTSSVSVASSNATLLPTSNIVIGGTAPNCTLSLTPFAGGIGTSSVTLTLSDTLDTASNSFTFAVTPTSLPITATGGTISYLTSGGTLYKLHTFTSVGSATFDVTNSDGATQVEYLIVAGGGGGAAGCPGMYAFPGGGGQVRTGNTVVTAQSYPITVGAGGVGTVQTIAGPGQNGSSSAVFSLSAAGGGAGGNSCLSGASGAGFAAGTNNGSATSGGGGAGAVGGNASGVNGPLHGGAGGIGVSSSITGTSTGYGGGGSGDGYNPGGSGGNVSVDGGGKGSPDNPSWAAPSNRGGGGSAAYFNPLANGGSGVVILRYPIGTP